MPFLDTIDVMVERKYTHFGLKRFTCAYSFHRGWWLTALVNPRRHHRNRLSHCIPALIICHHVSHAVLSILVVDIIRTPMYFHLVPSGVTAIPPKALLILTVPVRAVASTWLS